MEVEPRRVDVPARRWERWLENFTASHGVPVLSQVDGALRGRAPDGAWFDARAPFGPVLDADPAGPATRGLPDAWGVLLVRKAGFAVARLAGDEVVASKVSRRHVQGRSKAGGQSQQRFARRRDNQATSAYAAAAEHAVVVLGATPLSLVVGGDRRAVALVLEHPGLRRHDVVGPWLPMAEPRRAELDAAVASASAVHVVVASTPRDGR